MHPHGVGVSIVSPGLRARGGHVPRRRLEAAPGIGTTTPGKVAGPSSGRFERNRNEITVAPRRQRFVAEIGYRHPEFAARVQRRGGAERIAEELAAGQADKR